MFLQPKNINTHHIFVPEWVEGEILMIAFTTTTQQIYYQKSISRSISGSFHRTGQHIQIEMEMCNYSSNPYEDTILVSDQKSDEAYE
jgi:hypothetical protein